MTINQYKLAQNINIKNPTYAQVFAFNQHTFGSLCRRGWVDYDAYSERFFCTDECKQYLKYLGSSKIIFRKRNNGKLSQFVVVKRRRGHNVVQLRRMSA